MKKYGFLFLALFCISLFSYGKNGRPLRKMIFENAESTVIPRKASGDLIVKFLKEWRVKYAKDNFLPMCEDDFYQGLAVANNYLYYAMQMCGGDSFCGLNVSLTYQQMTLYLELQFLGCERAFAYPI